MWCKRAHNTIYGALQEKHEYMAGYCFPSIACGRNEEPYGSEENFGPFSNGIPAIYNQTADEDPGLCKCGLFVADLK